jgi:hypothetical protein
MEIDAVLQQLLQSNQQEFERAFKALAKANARGLLSWLRASDGLNTLVLEMAGHDVRQLVADFLLSRLLEWREIGFLLFDKLALTSLPETCFTEHNHAELAIMLLSFQRVSLRPQSVPRFLLAFAPAMQTEEPFLRELYKQEMVLQSKNFPTSCMTRLKEHRAQSAIVEEAVTEAEEYFEHLKPCFNSAINSIEIPGLSRAVRIKVIRESREISKYVEEHSVFGKFFGKSYLLYGGIKYRSFSGGRLNPISELSQFSAESELPRLEIIDPDGMAQRRFRAGFVISRLLEHLGNAGGIDES